MWQIHVLFHEAGLQGYSVNSHSDNFIKCYSCNSVLQGIMTHLIYHSCLHIQDFQGSKLINGCLSGLTE